MTYKLNYREVELEEVDYNDGIARVIEAYFLDTEEMLSEEDLTEITEIYQEVLAADCQEKLLEYAYDYAQGSY